MMPSRLRRPSVGFNPTMPFAVFKQLVKHPLTDAGLEKFLGDWKALREELEKGA